MLGPPNHLPPRCENGSSPGSRLDHLGIRKCVAPVDRYAVTRTERCGRLHPPGQDLLNVEVIGTGAAEVDDEVLKARVEKRRADLDLPPLKF